MILATPSLVSVSLSLVWDAGRMESDSTRLSRISAWLSRASP